MIRNILAVVAGYATWTVIFLVGSQAVRGAMPGVHDADGFTTHTLALVSYLLVSVAASLAAGYVTARMAKGLTTRWVGVLALALLATGIPVQLSAWDRIPLWYNLVFLAALAPVTLAGGNLGSRSDVRE